MRELPRPSLTAVWEDAGGIVTGRNGGPWVAARCVLHDDATASAAVNEDEGKWRCFTCDKGGDVIELIQELHGAGFNDAVTRAETFVRDGHGTLPSADNSGGSGLFKGQGHRQGNGAFKPPWIR